MDRTAIDVAGLTSLVTGSARDAKVLVVLLHGYAMRPEDLEPFAHAMGVRALFFFPRAPLVAASQGFAWWPIDEARRAEQLAHGPRDLASVSPATLPQLRNQLGDFLRAVKDLRPSLPLVLGGFSQGGMLASDFALHEPDGIEGLVLLSSSRISIAEWSRRQGALKKLPILITHGRRDPDLAFATGEALREFHDLGGANVSWVPFDGGHETPLVVWRSLRNFLRGLGA